MVSTGNGHHSCSKKIHSFIGNCRARDLCRVDLTKYSSVIGCNITSAASRSSRQCKPSITRRRYTLIHGVSELSGFSHECRRTRARHARRQARSLAHAQCAVAARATRSSDGSGVVVQPASLSVRDWLLCGSSRVACGVRACTDKCPRWCCVACTKVSTETTFGSANVGPPTCANSSLRWRWLSPRFWSLSRLAYLLMRLACLTRIRECSVFRSGVLHIFGLGFPASFKRSFKEFGATVAERLAHSPPTKTLVGGFSRGSPVSSGLSFRRRSLFTSITLIGSQDLAVKSRPLISSLTFLIQNCWSDDRIGRAYAVAMCTTSSRGTTVAERLAHSPPTKAMIRVQHPGG
ncbi:hypothetical protein PR048_033347 [Dryococelus australis]|uniref:Uncharacterized protein n=1 Tax=Dryococelus australis TaxID=614101 RepID=A0ABQ9G008_9NEOP|nr:hypothetical protein PR048_033347 [Dryococelus australis]